LDEAAGLAFEFRRFLLPAKVGGYPVADIAKILEKIRPNEYCSKILETRSRSIFSEALGKRVIFRTFSRSFRASHRRLQCCGMKIASL
jgi:hypothetical protein